MGSKAFDRTTDKTDDGIRATNDEAVRMRMSVVRLGYYCDPYIRHFEQPSTDTHPCSSSDYGLPRPNPLMNRGTYARIHSIEILVRRFLKLGAGRKQVVVFGAGDDTLGFRVMNEGGKDLRWVELDFEEVVERKSCIVKENMKGEFERLEMLRGKRGSIGYTRKGGVWCLMSVDLRKIKDVERTLWEAGLTEQLPTLFLSECVLIYMKPEESDKIVEMANRMFSGPRMFINFEQIEPHDPFGKQMVSNIARRGCPLLGIFDYPSLQSQRDRFRRFGWAKVEAITMFDYYEHFLEIQEKKRIGKIEMLDEIEEWAMLMSHYCLLWAVAGVPKDDDEILSTFTFRRLDEST